MKNSNSIARMGFLLMAVCVFFAQQVSGQVPVGQWRAHLSYHSIQDVTGSEERIFAAGTNGILIYNKDYNNPENLNKVNGLSDAGISALAWSEEHQVLLVGYRNGNLDVWRDGKIRNYSSLRDQGLYSPKRIRDIFFWEDKAYLSCSFGVAVFDLQSREFLESFNPVGGSGAEVYSLAHQQGEFFVATSQGLFHAAADAPGLDNPARWQQVTAFSDPSRPVASLRSHGEYVVFAVQAGQQQHQVYYLDETGGVDLLLESQVQALEGGSRGLATSALFICSSDRIFVYDQGLSLNQTLKGYMPQPRPTSLFEDQDGVWWLGDNGYGLVRYHQGQAESIIYNGPHSDRIFVVKAFGKQILGVPGGYDAGRNPQNTDAALYGFREEQWTNRSFPDYRDIVDIATVPGQPGRYMMASWGDGLLEVKDGEVVQQYDQDNSPLEPYNLDQIRVDDLWYDPSGNLWLTNHKAENPIKVLDSRGEWHVARYDALQDRAATGLTGGQDGLVWGYIHNTPLLFAVDTRGTPDDPSDDVLRLQEVLDFNGQSFARRLEALERDKEGNLWIATDEGVAVDYEPGSFFDREDYRPNRIRLTIEGYTQYILRDNQVTDIAVDPANQKWFATKRAGVFVFSEDAQELRSHYTSVGSPLLSDTVRSLAVGDGGEAFMATARGICSYRSESAAGKADFQDAYVFPNPVRPGYEGKITITNLVAGVNVKITDISGNLVYETIARGGQATWDGKNLSGHKVSTGVYLIFMTNEDGSKTHVGKLLFLK